MVNLLFINIFLFIGLFHLSTADWVVLFGNKTGDICDNYEGPYPGSLRGMTMSIDTFRNDLYVFGGDLMGMVLEVLISCYCLFKVAPMICGDTAI